MAPALPLIRHELGFSFSLAGFLASLPVLCLSAAAIPGAVLSNRIGARRVVGFGLLVLGLGSIVRIAPGGALTLFVGTALLAVAVAMSQPALSVVVRNWFPTEVTRAAAVTGNALNVGGLLGAVVTVYLLWLGWRGTFVAWAVPALVVGLLWLAFAPGRGDTHQASPSGLRLLLGDRGVIRAGLLFGCQSIAYFTASTWIPFLVGGRGSGYLAIVLGSLSLALVIPSLVLITIRFSYPTSRAYYIAAGLSLAVGGLGLALDLIGWAWLLAFLLGLGSSMTFLGAMATPSLLARRETQVAAYSALMLTLGYAISFVGPVLGGVLVDRTGALGAPFWVVAVSGFAVVVLGATLPRRRGTEYSPP